MSYIIINLNQNKLQRLVIITIIDYSNKDIVDIIYEDIDIFSILLR